MLLSFKISKHIEENLYSYYDLCIASAYEFIQMVFINKNHKRRIMCEHVT